MTRSPKFSQKANGSVVEAAYIGQARRVLTAQRLKRKAIHDEVEAKKAAAKSMNAVHIREFKFRVDEKKFVAKLYRPQAERISVQKLYTLVREGEISLDGFLECVTVNEKFAEDLLGESRLPSLRETYTKGLDLVIRRA